MSQRKKLSEQNFYTSGQVAKSLRISVSTLKRWLTEEYVLDNIKSNSKGWRLFSPSDIEKLKEHQKLKRRKGKKFKAEILRPVDQ